MMRARMFGADAEASTSEYSDLTDAACALIPACAAARALTPSVTAAASGYTDEVAQKVTTAISTGVAPAIVQLQRLESTITWAAVGTIVALVAATGTMIYFSARRR